jgi:ATP-dependent DNA helicase RecQ
VIGALEAHPNGLSVPELMSLVNIGMGRIEKTIVLLSLESPAPIAKQGTKWQLTASTLGESFWQRAERLTTLRREEQRQMREYVDLRDGHMEYLIRALDGIPVQLDRTALPPLAVEVQPRMVEAAITFLQRTSLPFEPRKQWPNGGLPVFKLKGRISPTHQAGTGMALCYWGDAGWGGQVRDGKYKHARFGDDLVAACAEMVHKWNPTPTPGWIGCIPSLRHPELVPDFARRLGTALNLPFHQVLTRCEDRPPQKEMANSIQQARNVDGSLQLSGEGIPAGPVLLVDDMVDSRWTLTIAAWLLRSNGCGEVHPLALAMTGRGQ